MKNNRVVLAICPPVMDLQTIYPSAVMKPQIGEIPLGILYIAGELEKHGFDVIILDNSIEQLHNYQFSKKIADHSPLVVGFSLFAFNVRSTRDTARLLKELKPDIPIVFGGPHASLLPEQQAVLNFVDFVITHMGEISFTEIALKMKEGAFPLKSTPSEKIIRGKTPKYLDDLSDPARHLIDINKYRRKSYVLEIEPIDFIASTRGCPFECAFCSSKTFWEGRYYKRSASKIVDEIELLIKEYGSKGIYFREDNFTVDKKHVVSVCDELIGRGIKILWECESRVDTLDKETLSKMKEAGCSAIWCEIESGCQKTLDRIKKGYTLEKVYQFVEWCNELCIEVGACYIIGFPGENSEDIIKTFNFASELPVKWSQFATYVGFPKSELYEDYLKNSLWEDKWEDVLITRNEHFTTKQLYAIENKLNIDIKKRSSKRYIKNNRKKNDKIWTYLIHALSSFINPQKLWIRIKAAILFIKEPSLIELMEKFNKENQKSNP
jgi:radical SAM superfamily enzyme YgiQ (UPF0313 family)